MKKITCMLLALLLLPASILAQKDNKPDIKFQKEAEKLVWGKENPAFNPNEKLTDSIFQNVAAAYIAVECTTDALRKETVPLVSTAKIERRYFGETQVLTTTRKMVKILELEALEEFSSFEFQAPKNIKMASNIDVFSTQAAFGARIFKENGDIINVDISQALPVTEGKKDKVSAFRIPIPGLEVGDVLDFFRLSKITFLGNQGIDTDYHVFGKYPIKTYSYNGSFDNILTTSFNTFNGLTIEAFDKIQNSDRTIVSLTINDIESLEDQQWSNLKRQFPFIHLRIEDNYSKIFPVKYHKRRTGFLPNLVSQVVMTEIAERFQKNQLPDNAVSQTMNLINKYRKNNQELSESELCDVAWIASRYHASESKESFDNWDVVCLFKDVADKLKLSIPVQLAVSTKHTDVWIREVAEINQVTPMVIIGDRVYIHGAERSLKPGELPEEFAGEEAFTFTGKRSSVYDEQLLNVITLPESRPNDNSEHLTINLKLSENNNSFDFNYTNVLKGSSKALANVLVNSKDFINQCEDFLEVRANKR